MNPFEMVAVIVVAVLISSVLRARYGYRHRGGGSAEVDPAERGETLRLREEVKDLKERIKVLERITVEKENSLAKQIEELRDH
jgi:hypothetical protein